MFQSPPPHQNQMLHAKRSRAAGLVKVEHVMLPCTKYVYKTGMLHVKSCEYRCFDVVVVVAVAVVVAVPVTVAVAVVVPVAVAGAVDDAVAVGVAVLVYQDV
jgi:hypothetical protein